MARHEVTATARPKRLHLRRDEERCEDDAYPNTSREFRSSDCFRAIRYHRFENPSTRSKDRHHVDCEVAEAPPAERCALTLILPEPECPEPLSEPRPLRRRTRPRPEGPPAPGPPAPASRCCGSSLALFEEHPLEEIRRDLPLPRHAPTYGVDERHRLVHLRVPEDGPDDGIRESRIAQDACAQRLAAWRLPTRSPSGNVSARSDGRVARRRP